MYVCAGHISKRGKENGLGYMFSLTLPFAHGCLQGKTSMSRKNHVMRRHQCDSLHVHLNYRRSPSSMILCRFQGNRCCDL